MEKYNPFEIALDKTFGEFPKLKKPLESNSNGNLSFGNSFKVSFLALSNKLIL